MMHGKETLFFIIRKLQRIHEKHIARHIEDVLERSPKFFHALFVLALVASLVLGPFAPVQAATYTFVQGSWSGGADTVTTAVHPTNTSGWNKFYSSSNVSAGATVTLTSAASSSVQTSDTDFNSGTNSSTAVTGSGASGSVSLATTSMATFSTGASTNPTDVIFDPSTNSIWVSLETTGKALKLNPSTGATIGTYFGGTSPAALAFGSSTNSIWVAAYGDTQLREIRASDGTVLHMYNTSDQLTRIAYDSSTNSVWGVHDTYHNTVYKINASTGATTGSYAVSTLGTYANNVVFDSSTNSIWVPESNQSLYKVKAADGTNVGFAVTNLNAKPIVFDSSTNSVWAITNTSGFATSTIKKFKALDGSLLGTYVDTRHNGATALTFDPVTNSVWEANGSNVYKINASGSIAGTFNTGGSGPRSIAFDPVTNSVWVAYYTSNNVARIPVATYQTSGTFTSNVIDTSGKAGFTTLTFTKTTPANTTLTIDVRAGNTAIPDGSWTAWQTNIASGGSISALGANRYVQYRANLATADTTVTPTLSDVTFNYTAYNTSGSIISSKYDSGSPGNLIAKLSWTGSGTSSPVMMQLQVRSAATAVGLDSAPWCGYSDTTTCAGSNYFTDANNGVIIGSSNPLRTGGDDEWFQYKVTYLSDGSATPTLTGVTVQYVVNAPPQFDATYGTNGVSVAQDASSTDATWGKVLISYRVTDPDALSGSATPGYVTPSFEYNTGTGWTAIPSQYLAAGDTTNKLVSESSYTTYTASWDAASQLGTNTYSSTAQVRVTVNDNEAANNTAQATSANFTVDTKPPTVSGVHLDASSATPLSFAVSDNSAIKDYVLSNNADFSADGINSSSGVYQDATSTTLGATQAWNLSNTTSPTVYLKVRDSVGNILSTSVTIPATPSNFQFKDISSPDLSQYREFVAWNLYPSPAPSGATFQSYDLYRSTDGSTYSLLSSITDSSRNYYIDSSVSSTTTYYYKLQFVTTAGNKTPFSTPITDQPDGVGGNGNGAKPNISGVTISEVKNTSAKVTWVTDELSTSEVNYGTNNSYGHVATNGSYVTSHSVYINNLTPNTTYYVRVSSDDILGGTSVADNGGAGYSFTTSSGAIITNVTISDISDHQATVFWNTNVSADSYVDYSMSSNLASYQEAGNGALVTATGAPFQHTVTLSGLTPATNYYFRVKSTDSGGNTTTDTNNDIFYSFTTTLDITPPVISAIQSPVKSENAAVITWQTDKLADSQVEYGLTSGTYGSVTVLNSTPSIFHVVTLSPETLKQGGGTNELTASTTYYFRVRSTDRAGNTATSDEQTVTTAPPGNITVVNVTYGPSYTPPDMTPPILKTVAVATSSATEAAVTVTADRPVIAIVHYGTSQSYDSSAADSQWSPSHTITLSHLQMGATYHFDAYVVGKNGQDVRSNDSTFSTNLLSEDLGSLQKLPPQDITQKLEDLIESSVPSINPPFIEHPAVTEVTEDSATIIWRTNVKAFGSVAYTVDDGTGSTTAYTGESNAFDQKTYTHTVTLGNLKSNTLYHYQVKSFVFPQVVGKSDDLTFITKAGKIEPQILNVKNDSFDVVWNSDTPMSSAVEYRSMGGGSTNKKSLSDVTTSHDVLVDHLTPGVVYEVTVYGFTKDGNRIDAKSDLTVALSRDTTPPKIDSFKVDSALVPGRTDRVQTIISWKTDEPATGAVHYEEGSGVSGKELANKIEDTTTLTTNHVFLLTSLKPGSVYRVQISATDEAGNILTLPARTIVTPRQSESISDVIFKNFEDTFQFLKKVP